MTPIDIGVLQRGRGMAYTFVENQSHQWSWRSMLASFSDDVLEEVVGEGVLTITCEPWATTMRVITRLAWGRAPP